MSVSSKTIQMKNLSVDEFLSKRVDPLEIWTTLNGGDLFLPGNFYEQANSDLR